MPNLKISATHNVFVRTCYARGNYSMYLKTNVLRTRNSLDFATLEEIISSDLKPVFIQMV